MDPGQSAGRLLVCALPSPELDSESEAALRDLGPAGVILFERNLRSVAQVRDLVVGLREISSLPLLVAIDQEGGAVNRLRRLDERFLALPPARVQAGFERERLEAIWQAIGHALVALGVDIAFAPVVDLDDAEGANGIGPRSFGTEPERVTEAAYSVLRGLAAAGVAGCLKHFPGLGGTLVDTHLELARSPLGAEDLREKHARPFEQLASEAPLIMTAHAHYPAVDGEDPLPATFSHALVGDWLRRRFNYDGIVVSDDLEMGAVAEGRPPGERALRAIDAGCDLALFCKELDAPRRARDELARRIEGGDLPPTVLVNASRRLACLFADYPGAREHLSSPAAFGVAVEALIEKLGLEA